ncbi:MAG: chromosome segregation protein SMC [Deltaproteobacteria bacterium RIFCSPLOWO2_02_FULL_46_8]|nr:MAG: chromosome segregation protein SMC [Deltaproteobacteria bacterium RIFCSPLOWO2_02_FULL_46_8]
MKLKSLELFGFKSFVDKTLVQFDEGITGIVGPNGCGKSNIVDSIRWVMGEQSARHLRGSEMQDVIFNGTSSRSPLGMSQVALTFDLSDGRAPAGYTDYSEIQVERRLYRSGDSEYYINKVPCRLRDIVDLFLGTGVGTKAYSIIEQGRIERILSAKPEERRFIIEEAAGISKFKNRKEAALRKIESTEANLARLNDIVGEIKRQLNALDRQARKAERYKTIYEELKGRELKLSSVRYQQLREDSERLEAEGVDLSQNEASLAAKLSQVETENEREKLNLAALEQKLNGVQEKFYMQQNAVKLHETSLEYQQNKLKDLARQLEVYAKEIEEFKVKLAKSETEIESLNDQKLTHDLSVASAAERIKALEARVAEALQICNDWQSKTEKKNREMLVSVSQVAESQSRLEYLERRNIEVEGRVAKGQSEIDNIDRLRKELEEKAATSDTDLSSLKQLSFKLSDEKTQVRQDLDEKKTSLQGEIQKLEAVKNELAAKQSRLNSLQEIHNNMEGFRDGVRTVLKASEGELNGILNPVSEIVDCEPKFEAAVSAALGDKLQYVVVQSQQAGVDAIDYLRTQSKGRSTFVPLDIRGEEKNAENVEGPGVVGPLLQNVHFNDDYRQIADYLFGDCVLVEDLKDALHLWQQGPQDKTLVTLQGEVIDRSGIISGGAGVEGEILLGHKRRIEAMEKEVSEAKASVFEQEKECWHLKNQVHSLEERLESLSRDSHSEEIRIVHQEKDGVRLREELVRYNQDRDRLSMEIARCMDEKREIVAEMEKVALLLEERITQQSSMEKELACFQVELTSASEAKNQAQNYLSHAQAQLAQAQDKAEVLEREIQQWIANKLELEAGIEKRIAEINLGQNQIQQLNQSQITERAQLETAVKDLDHLTQKQKSLRIDYDALSLKIKERDGEVREIRRRHEEMVKAKHANDLKLAESKNHLQILVDQILERYKIEISHYVPQTVLTEEWNIEEEGRIINDLRDRLEKLGSVHVGAIEEYDELKNRHEFLSKQQEDLVKSLEALKRAIQKINRVSRERFLKTFESVNDKFQEIFPRLFKGGRAKLILMDEENLMEAGVEIVAQPPGKKLQSITLLSGGEKALTAVALIFSIFLIKPSPFCLLDEVDAPLDDANITRFNDMVREMTSQSQFIVITHNKRTMEKADCLYGITMEEAGVSKVVSVRLNEGATSKQPEAQVA